MKTLFLTLILASTIGTLQAQERTDTSMRGMIGTCIAVQAARLDDGSQSLDVIGKAVAAGCMPTLRAALAAGNGTQVAASRVAFVRDDYFDGQEADNTMQDMAVSVVQWLRASGNARLLVQRRQ